MPFCAAFVHVFLNFSSLANLAVMSLISMLKVNKLQIKFTRFFLIQNL